MVLDGQRQNYIPPTLSGDNNFCGPSPPFRCIIHEGCCNIQAQVCARSTGQPFVKACAQKNVWLGDLFVCLFLLLYVPCQQLWSLRDGQFT